MNWQTRSRLEMAIVMMILIIMFIVLVWLMLTNANEWEKFSAQHNCKVVGKMKGSANYGYGLGMTSGGQPSTGMVIINQPSKTGYLCDDGVTYWR